MSQIESKTIEGRIDEVLERLRPFLQRDGGDIVLDHFDEEDGTCYVEMIGACAGCSSAESDITDSVEVLLMDEVPEIRRVLLIQPEQPDFASILERLRAEEQANRELEELNRQRREVVEEEKKD